MSTKSTVSQVVFVISIFSISIIIASAITALFIGKFEFFPPPSKVFWQHRVF